MSYSANVTDLFRRSAVYVDKILEGAKPGDLPVEQPTKFELVINLKTAKQISLTILPAVLGRAEGDQIGDAMAELGKGKPLSLEELMVSTLAMTDALAKLLIGCAGS